MSLYVLAAIPFGLFSVAHLCDLGCFDTSATLWGQAIFYTLFWPATIWGIINK